MNNPFTCNHSWSVNAQSFTIVCTKCEVEFIPAHSQQIISGDFGIGPNDIKPTKRESPSDAYDRAMRGIK